MKYNEWNLKKNKNKKHKNVLKLNRKLYIITTTTKSFSNNDINIIMKYLDCNGHIQHQQNMKQSINTSLDGSTLVSLVPATKSSSLASSTSSSTSNNLTAMMQQVPNSMISMANLLSPSKPQNISELSNSSMVSSSSGSSTLDSSSGMNSNSLAGTPTSKRSRSSKNYDSQKDGKYFERRKRNNVAAKKSRDARKQREDEIAIRASFLEKENSILKAQLQTLKDEAQQLRILLAQKKSSSLAAAAAAASNNCSNCTNCSTKSNSISIINNSYAVKGK